MLTRIRLLLLFSFCAIFLRAQNVEFVLLADIHLTNEDPRVPAMEQVVAELNTENYPFVVVAGDLTRVGSTEELLLAKSTLDKIKSKVYVVPGNHETNWSQSGGRDLARIFGEDRFAFIHNNALYVGLSTGPYMRAGDGHVRAEDEKWLEQTIAQKAKPGMPVIMFSHYPLTKGLNNYNRIVSMLNKYNVTASFCGHGHRYVVNPCGSFDNYMTRALLMGKENAVTFGYSIIKVTPDSIYMYEKVVNQPRKLKYAFENKIKDSRVTESPIKNVPLPAPIRAHIICRDEASVFSGIVADKQNIYWGNSKGEFVVADKNNGTIVKRFPTECPIFSTPVITPFGIVVASTNGVMYSFDKQGNLQWSHVDGRPFMADGLFFKEKIYQGGKDILYCVNAKNGTVQWKYDKIQNYCQARPLLYDGELIFGAWDSRLYNLDAKSGRENWVWKNRRKSILYSPGNCTPIAYGESIYIVSPDNLLRMFDNGTGNEIWRNDTYLVRESMGQSEDKKTGYAKLMDGRLLAFDLTRSKFTQLWCTDMGIGREFLPSRIVEHKGVVYVSTTRGEIIALDAKTGTVSWQYKFGDSAIYQLYINQDAIYFALAEGVIYRLSLS